MGDGSFVKYCVMQARICGRYRERSVWWRNQEAECLQIRLGDFANQKLKALWLWKASMHCGVGPPCVDVVLSAKSKYLWSPVIFKLFSFFLSFFRGEWRVHSVQH